MVIRIPSRGFPQNPVTAQSATRIVPVQPSPAAIEATARFAGNAASIAAGIYREERDKQIETRVLELDIARREADGAVVDAYREALGRNAVDGREKAIAAIASNSKRVRGLTNDAAVSAAWRKQDAALTFSSMQQVDDHYRRENVRWQDDTKAARTDLLVSDTERVAFGEGYDPATGQVSREADRARSGYLDTIEERGKLRGWDKEVVEAEKRKADTRSYAQIAESLIRQERYQEADNVLVRYGDRIDVGVRDQLKQSAKVGQEQASVLGKAQKAVDEMDSKNMGVEERYGWVQAGFEAGTISPRERAAIEDEIAQRGSRNAAIVAAAGNRVEQRAREWLIDNPNSTPRMLPPDIAKDVAKFGLIDDLNGFADSGNRYVTDTPYLASIEKLLRDKGTARRIDSEVLRRESRGKLNDRDLNYIMALHAKQTDTETKQSTSILSNRDRVDLALAKLKPGKLEDEDKDKFREEFDKQLQHWQDTRGKVATSDDIQRMLDTMVNDVVQVEETHVRRGFSDPGRSVTPMRMDKALLLIGRKPQTMAEAGFLGREVFVPVDRSRKSGGNRVRVGEIPKDVFDAIARGLEAADTPATYANVARLWVRNGEPMTP